MNTSTPRRITPDCQPDYPCYLWDAHLGIWTRAAYGPCDRFMESLADCCTHWHPDQPTAPTCEPDAPAQPATGTPSKEGVVRQGAYDHVCRLLEKAESQLTAQREAWQQHETYGAKLIADLRTELTAQREAHEREMAANHGFKLCFPYPADISMKPALFKDGGYHYYVPEGEADDLRTRLAETQIALDDALSTIRGMEMEEEKLRNRLALADELAEALEDMTIAFVTTFTASHDQKDAATCKAVSALTRYRSASAPSKSP